MTEEMKRHMTVLSAALLLSVGCSDNNRSVPSAPVGLRADNVNLTLSSGNSTLKVGQTLQLSIVHTHNGLTYTGNAVWQSSAPAVAAVDSTGLVTAVSPGTASITATNASGEQDDGSVTITVMPNVLTVTGLTWNCVFGLCPISGGTISGAPPNSPVSAYDVIAARAWGGTASLCGWPTTDAQGNLAIPLDCRAVTQGDQVYFCPNDWVTVPGGYAGFALGLLIPGAAAANDCAGPFTAGVNE